MKNIDAKNLTFTELNEQIRLAKCDVTVNNLLGQRFIGAGLSGVSLILKGVPGNALGAYLNGATVKVLGNAQDAVGDTMNDGKIIIDGNIGDAVGYAMRGGKIFIKGNAGYRAGIHIKEYKEKVPVIVIGGSAGCFLGEYQAGGVIIVLGLNSNSIVGDFPCTGMYGGKMLLRCNPNSVTFPKNVKAKLISKKELLEFSSYITEFCDLFGYNYNDIINGDYTLVVPDSNNPYKQMYVSN